MKHSTFKFRTVQKCSNTHPTLHEAKSATATRPYFLLNIVFCLGLSNERILAASKAREMYKDFMAGKEEYLEKGAIFYIAMAQVIKKERERIGKALVSAAQLSGAQSARSFGLSASASGARIPIGEC